MDETKSMVHSLDHLITTEDSDGDFIKQIGELFTAKTHEDINFKFLWQGLLHNYNYTTIDNNMADPLKLVSCMMHFMQTPK